MPYSYAEGKEEFKKHFTETFKYTPNMQILDVGAGAGAYSHLLRSYFNNMDALEIFMPYITEFKLYELYRTVIKDNILSFDVSDYKYLIMGDILEHLTYEQAFDLLSRLHAAGKMFMVAVPYLYPQGECYNNVYETHHQPDLTHQIFMQRYPMMITLWKDDKYGYYINY
jgi:cyclopropane fatty-acyl-phospholipid synthase-like methyltransferase